MKMRLMFQTGTRGTFLIRHRSPLTPTHCLATTHRRSLRQSDNGQEPGKRPGSVDGGRRPEIPQMGKRQGRREIQQRRNVKNRQNLTRRRAVTIATNLKWCRKSEGARRSAWPWWRHLLTRRRTAVIRS